MLVRPYWSYLHRFKVKKELQLVQGVEAMLVEAMLVLPWAMSYLRNTDFQKALLQTIQHILNSTLPDFPKRARITGLRRL